jgi:hypothetical protein
MKWLANSFGNGCMFLGQSLQAITLGSFDGAYKYTTMMRFCFDEIKQYKLTGVEPIDSSAAKGYR